MSSYLPIIMLFIILFILRKREKRELMLQIIRRKRTSERFTMTELIKNYIDKECIIYAFETQITGIIKQVTDKAVLIECKDGTQIINTDFIVRVREYPRDKNGKKKSIITN